jgi:ATP-dependent protease HslVU (ClpYQ) peptidase subunit
LLDLLEAVDRAREERAIRIRRRFNAESDVVHASACFIVLGTTVVVAVEEIADGASRNKPTWLQ